MKPYFSVLLAGVAAATFAITAAAQPAPAAPGKTPGSPQLDCAKWKDKARCESLNKDIEACRDKTDDDWRHCMHHGTQGAKFSPPKARDCSMSRNKERCEAHAVALGACKDRSTRGEHRKCMAEQIPAQAPKKD